MPLVIHWQKAARDTPTATDDGDSPPARPLESARGQTEADAKVDRNETASPLSINGLRDIPVDVEKAQSSGFAAIVSALPLPSRPVVVDVGEGGFVGATTTDHLVRLIDGTVLCLEPQKHLAARLADKFGNNITIIDGVYGNTGVKQPFDLIVFDLPSGAIPSIYHKLLDFALADGLREGGYAICLLIYDLPKLYLSSKASFSTTGYSAQKEFMTAYFGAEKVDPAIIEAAFVNDPRFEFIGLVDKFLEDDSGIGWVVLRRRPSQ
jgi:hypothetical protein